MRVGLVAWIGATVVLTGGSNAVAQERGQFGLTTGYPAAIGVVWHVTDRFGIRGNSVLRSALRSSMQRRFCQDKRRTPTPSASASRGCSMSTGTITSARTSALDSRTARSHRRLKDRTFPSACQCHSHSHSHSHTDPEYPQRVVELLVRRIVRRPVFAEPAVRRFRRARTQLCLAAGRIVVFVLVRD